MTTRARVSASRHYPSDVIAGASIGILTARIFDGLHWGVDEKGGIARPSMELSFGLRGERGFLLQLGVDF